MTNNYDSLLLSPKTKSQLETFTLSPANALLLTGKIGSGKKQLAINLAARLLGTSPERVFEMPQFLRVTKPEDKTEISIESVREVAKKLSLRVAADNNYPINRIVLFEDAQTLSQEAQNALLKLLEEPPHRSLLILTADSDDNLLPTVISRTQRITVTAPSLDQAIDYFKNHPNQQVAGAYMLSGGAVELLESLLDDSDNHSLKIGVNQAKLFIKSDTYNRLVQLQQISKDRWSFLVFLDALARVLTALHQGAIKTDKHSSSVKILDSRKVVEQALAQAEHSSNIRLLSLSLALNFAL